MRSAYAWIAGTVVALMILGMFLIPQPPPHQQGTAYVVLHRTTTDQTRKAPPGNWLVVRRIVRP